MEVLVVHASRHGSTAGIAERIAAGLQAAGLSAEAVAVSQVGDVARYDAFVIGSAAYLFHWLKDATRFVKRHRAVLETRPVWLFSSGPLGTDRTDDQGDDVLEATRPKEFDELATLVHLAPEPDGTQAAWWLEQLEPWPRQNLPVSSLFPSRLGVRCSPRSRFRHPRTPCTSRSTSPTSSRPTSRRMRSTSRAWRSRVRRKDADRESRSPDPMRGRVAG
jgi:flavodoxin